MMVVVPEPTWAKVPVPLTTGLKATDPVSSIARAALLAMLPGKAETGPRNVPALIVVSPVYEFGEFRTTVPVPDFLTVPDPLMEPIKVPVVLWENTMDASLAMVP